MRASRSIAANIGEGWGRCICENEFKKYLVYAMGSLEETKGWLQFSKDCNYLSAERYEELRIKADLIGSKLYKLHENWKSF